ncbi:MAG: MarR family winged helix-turn-helix transcriptional regulator [Sphaerochaeta sp.]|jgi:DNA-binding MarR family transcriptional regulator|nr:MarR family winged helix-turn-helix transcriptional regulator [Sphaerochaeta sp.]
MYSSLARHLAILHRHNQRYLNQVLKPYSLTSGEVGFLMSLYQTEGQTQEELSAALVIDKAATARALKVLIDKGFVTRTQDEKDKRCNRIHLTEHAKALEGELTNQVRRWNQNLIEQFGSETYEQICAHLASIQKELS